MHGEILSQANKVVSDTAGHTAFFSGLHVHRSAHMYIYTTLQRKKEREREQNTNSLTHTSFKGIFLKNSCSNPINKFWVSTADKNKT